MTPNPPPAPRAGLALVELLVALSVLAVGVLAAAGVAAALVRASGEADRAARAARLLEARAESLALARCAPAAGERRVGPLHERWTLTEDGDLLVLADTVAYVDPRGAPRRVGLRALRWCEP